MHLLNERNTFSCVTTDIWNMKVPDLIWQGPNCGQRSARKRWVLPSHQLYLSIFADHVHAFHTPYAYCACSKYGVEESLPEVTMTKWPHTKFFKWIIQQCNRKADISTCISYESITISLPQLRAPFSGPLLFWKGRRQSENSIILSMRC